MTRRSVCCLVVSRKDWDLTKFCCGVGKFTEYILKINGSQKQSYVLERSVTFFNICFTSTMTITTLLKSLIMSSFMGTSSSCIVGITWCHNLSWHFLLKTSSIMSAKTHLSNVFFNEKFA